MDLPTRPTPGRSLGTPHYMSPEQALGERNLASLVASEAGMVFTVAR